MTKCLVVGEVVSDIKLLKKGENDLFLSFVVKDDREVIRIYARNEVAVHINDKIKKGMIVYVECRLQYAKYNKWQDTFNLNAINIWSMFEKKPQFRELSKYERSGLNGKPLPF